jgi:hypothetical protein
MSVLLTSEVLCPRTGAILQCTELRNKRCNNNFYDIKLVFLCMSRFGMEKLLVINYFNLKAIKLMYLFVIYFYVTFMTLVAIWF